MTTIREGLARAGKGAKSVWQAVGKAASGMTSAQTTVGPGGPVDEKVLDQPALPEYSLPDLGPAPDPNDPKYTSDNSPAGGYENDLADYNHKQDIHKAMQELDSIYREAHPARDFKSEYQSELASLGKDPGYAPDGSLLHSLKRFALGLGDFNPAVQQTSGSNLKAADAKQEAYDTKKRELLRNMIGAKMKDAEEKGNWAVALKQHEQNRMMDLEDQTRAHQFKMEEDAARQQAITDRANIAANGRENAARIVADSRYGRGAKANEMAKVVAKAMLDAKYGYHNIMSQAGAPFDMNDAIDMADKILEDLDPTAPHKKPDEAPAPEEDNSAGFGGNQPAPAAAGVPGMKPPAKQSFRPTKTR